MTLNEFIFLLQQIATNHQQIRDFGFGEPWNIGKSKSPNYPLMWSEVQNSTTTGTKELDLKFTLYFIDQLNNDRSNLAEVQSDMLEVCKDVLAQLNAPQYDDNFIIDTTTPLTVFNDSMFDDLSAGWYADIKLKINYLRDRCAVPSTLAPIPIGTPLPQPMSEYTSFVKLPADQSVDGQIVYWNATDKLYEANTAYNVSGLGGGGGTDSFQHGTANGQFTYWDTASGENKWSQGVTYREIGSEPNLVGQFLSEDGLSSMYLGGNVAVLGVHNSNIQFSDSHVQIVAGYIPNQANDQIYSNNTGWNISDAYSNSIIGSSSGWAITGHTEFLSDVQFDGNINCLGAMSIGSNLLIENDGSGYFVIQQAGSGYPENVLTSTAAAISSGSPTTTGYVTVYIGATAVNLMTC